MIEHNNEIRIPIFPSTHTALDQGSNHNGLLASGGEVTPIWLNTAYRQGIFPWNSPDAPRLWWSPVPRAIITPESFRLSRTIKKLLKKPHCITLNLAFQQVMTACAQPRSGETGTWISTEMIQEYHRMHQAGRALSGEYWYQGKLAGGFYGILIGRAFFGESMFSNTSNASKLTFATIAPQLFAQGVELIDCQMHTAHLAQFGLQELQRTEFENRLNHAVNQPPISLPPCLYLSSP